MNQLAVIYWSGTGNTEAMAHAVAEGAHSAGADVKLLSADIASASDFESCDKFALGCPAMGDEVLEDSVFEPLYLSMLPLLCGKPAVLFGSYGWGDGQWMRDWKQRAESDGLILCADPLIVNEAPDEAALASCRSLGAALAEH